MSVEEFNINVTAEEGDVDAMALLLDGRSGSAADRPTNHLYVGRSYFDTQIGKPVWYDGTGWVDATGTNA